LELDADFNERRHGLEEPNEVVYLLLEVDEKLDTLNEDPLDLGLLAARC